MAKFPTNLEIVTRFMKQDEMNAVFVRMAISHFAAGVLEMQPQPSHSLISVALLQDIAHDWLDKEYVEEQAMR